MRLTMSVPLSKLRSSLTLRISAICLAAMHAPLLALVVFLISDKPGMTVPVLFTTLLATCLGTGLCLISVWALLRPLQAIAGTIETYRESGAVTAVHSPRQDEIGVVANAVSTLIGELDATLSQLRRQATTDVLTGLGNRRWLKDIGALEIARAAREDGHLCVIVFDLDNFKSINDEHGHDVGDQVLMMTGAIVQHGMRPYDIAARIGGEEFCILLPRTDIAQALSIAGRLRRELASKVMGPLPRGRVTASFGVYRGDASSETLKMMMMAADRKLYAAKNAGRNAVHWDVATPSVEDIQADSDGAGRMLRR
jgi:diguanylate cyclase (GGDEF)-like protein